MTNERKIEILKDLLIQLSDSANILCTCEADERCEVVEECIKALEQNTVSQKTYDNEYLARKQAEQKFWDLKRNCIEIPKDASNGDMIKSMFPFSVASLNLIEHSVCLKTDDGNKSYHDFVWWNAPYKRGAEND